MGRQDEKLPGQGGSDLVSLFHDNGLQNTNFSTPNTAASEEQNKTQTTVGLCETTQDFTERRLPKGKVYRARPDGPQVCASLKSLMKTHHCGNAPHPKLLF